MTAKALQRIPSIELVDVEQPSQLKRHFLFRQTADSADDEDCVRITLSGKSTLLKREEILGIAGNAYVGHGSTAWQRALEDDFGASGFNQAFAGRKLMSMADFVSSYQEGKETWAPPKAVAGEAAVVGAAASELQLQPLQEGSSVPEPSAEELHKDLTDDIVAARRAAGTDEAPSSSGLKRKQSRGKLSGADGTTEAGGEDSDAEVSDAGNVSGTRMQKV